MANLRRKGLLGFGKLLKLPFNRSKKKKCCLQGKVKIDYSWISYLEKLQYLGEIPEWK